MRIICRFVDRVSERLSDDGLLGAIIRARKIDSRRLVQIDLGKGLEEVAQRACRGAIEKLMRHPRRIRNLERCCGFVGGARARNGCDEEGMAIWRSIIRSSLSARIHLRFQIFPLIYITNVHSVSFNFRAIFQETCCL